MIGFILGAGEREASFIAGICGAGGYFIGELIKFTVKRLAEESVRSKSPEESQYSPEKWDEYKKKLKD